MAVYANKVRDRIDKERLPNDVQEWLDQMNHDSSATQLSASSKVEYESDCSVVVSLWEKMGKTTMFDSISIDADGCCDYNKIDIPYVHCQDGRVYGLYDFQY